MSIDEVMNDLQTPWKEDPKPQGDCISRQAAIDAIEPTLKSILQGNSFKAINVMDKIRELPSAQPDIARDIATILENERDMRVISQNAERNCKTCRYNGKEWYEEPCDSCTMGGDNNHYKPSVQPQRWIPVTEALPEDYVDVLVWFEYFRYGNYNCLYQTWGIGDYSEEYGSWMVNHESGWRKLRVIAWMPLPEPYTSGADMREQSHDDNK